MEDDLTFTIYPETELASVDLLRKSLEDISRLVKQVDRDIYGPKSKRQWYVCEIRSNAPTITMRPDPEGQKAVGSVVAGLRSVTEGTDRSASHFSEQALLDLRKMKRLFSGIDRAKSIAVSVGGRQTATIGIDIGDKVDSILAAGYHNLGSLEGTLEVINVRRAPTITVRDRVYGSPVRCRIPGEAAWIDRVKGLLEKRVMVAGYIHYFANGVPRSVTDITNIEDATPDPSLPKADFGSIPDALVREIGAAEWLTAIRGDA